MLNYIWGGLIVFSLVFAMVYDIRDFANDTYRNGEALPVSVAFPDGYQAEARRQHVEVRLNLEGYGTFYDTDQRPAAVYEGLLIQTADGRQLRFAEGVSVPEPLATIRSFTSSRDNDLRGAVGAFTPQASAAQLSATVTFDPVRWVKLNAIAGAALDFAETAVTIALSLIGGIALWMGLLQIAQASGILYTLIRVTQRAVGFHVIPVV